MSLQPLWDVKSGIQTNTTDQQQSQTILKAAKRLASQEFGKRQGKVEQTRQLWLNPDLREHEATRNLDALQPATLYYLGLIKDLPEVAEVYVEQPDANHRKIWSVLNERDFDAMEQIYDIEHRTLEKFPDSSLDFRVTIQTKNGSTGAQNSVKIFDSS